MLAIAIIVNAFLCLVGCAIAAQVAGRIRGDKSKRFLKALLFASVLSWVVFIFSGSHGGGGIKVLPSVVMVVQIIGYFKSSNHLSMEDFILLMIPVTSFLTIFATLCLFSREPGKKF